MTTFLGLDVATKTGWALYPQRNVASVRCGTIKVAGDTAREKCLDLGQKLVELIKRDRPDFCVIERPLQMIPKHVKVSRLMPDLEPETTINPGTTLLLNALFGAACVAVGCMGIPTDDVTAGTWRSKFFPKGVKGKNRQDWKRLAMEHCRLVKIPVNNSDEAEAVAIATYGPHSGEWKKILYRTQLAS